jgi:hypothetical protein
VSMGSRHDRRERGFRKWNSGIGQRVRGLVGGPFPFVGSVRLGDRHNANQSGSVGSITTQAPSIQGTPDWL